LRDTIDFTLEREESATKLVKNYHDLILLYLSLIIFIRLQSQDWDKPEINLKTQYENEHKIE